VAFYLLLVESAEPAREHRVRLRRDQLDGRCRSPLALKGLWPIENPDPERSARDFQTLRPERKMPLKGVIAVCSRNQAAISGRLQVPIDTSRGLHIGLQATLNSVQL
jgi:hypothetical protein